MVLLLVFGLFFFNLAISAWNAYAAGQAWVEAKHNGGWPRFMNWMAAIMSASGFTWCYLIVFAIIAGAADKLDEAGIEAMLNLGYIVIIPGVLFSGFMIWFDSWAQAYRERTVANFGVAGYNTFAQAYNTYNAVRGIGPAFKKVFEYFKPKDKNSAQAFLVILLVVLAVGCGAITTWVIINRVAANDEPLPVSYQGSSA